MNNGRTVGIILIVVGAAVAVLALAFFGINIASGELTSSGAVLGAAIIFLVLVAPLVGFGIFMTMQGGKDAARAARAEQQRQLLDIVRSVRPSDAVRAWARLRRRARLTGPTCAGE